MSEVINITDANFKEEVLDSDVLTVLDFGAEWCAPCKKLHPIMAEIASEFNGKVKIGYIDVGVAPRIAQKYAVMSVPRLIFFKDGKPIETVVGLIPKPKIIEKMDSYL
ncbi:MAG: thioredoxin fold domain-containing protein [candidate division Zixibacteria bacterium]|nr:thioredoxin fold domain-containing protein [Candidatus Tariuqbacter arcticus]